MLAFCPTIPSFKSIESGRTLLFVEGFALHSLCNFLSMCALSLTIDSPFLCIANALNKL